jgi:Asp-tRNA(Asn)/Glu-tRNA(Gln) amidotransferase A subunit family amidase
VPQAPVPTRAYVSEDLGFARVDDDVRTAFRKAIAALDLELEEAPALPTSVETWFTVATAEAFAADPPAGTAAARAFQLAGERVTTSAYLAAQFERERIHRRYAELLAGGAVLLTPTLGLEAFAELPDYDWGSFLYDANLAGLPACAVPMGLGREGLPVSLQITGARGADGAVLAVAQHIEERINDRAPARRR